MPYSLVLERVSAHIYSVQRKVEPTHLHVLCSVPAPSSTLEQILTGCVRGTCVSLSLVPWSTAERNGHIYDQGRSF